MKNPTFSILIPIIKGAFLAQAIESVINQTSSDWELVLYNDASPDNIGEIVERYNDQRMIYFKGDTNIGSEDPSRVWNRVLSFAHGEYVCLLGDDDFLDTNYLEEIQKLISQHPHVDVFRSKVNRVNEKGEVIATGELIPEHESWEQSFYQRNVKKRTQSTSEFILKKSALNSIGGYVHFPRACGSDDATYLLLAQKNGIVSTNNTAAYWRKSNLNISDNDNPELNAHKIKFLAEWEQNFLNTFFPLKVPAHELYKSIDEMLVKNQTLFFEEKLHNEQVQNSAIKQELQSVQAIKKELEEAKRLAQESIQQLQSQVHGLEGNIQDLKGEKELILKQADDLHNHLQLVSGLKNKLQEKCDFLENKLRTNEENISILKQRVEINEKRLDEERQNNEKNILELSERYQHILNLNKELGSSREEIQNFQQEVLSLNKELVLSQEMTLSRTSELSRIYLSREWKMIELVRKIVRVFIPKGSIRRAIVELLWESVKGPFRFFWQIKIRLKEKSLLKKRVFNESSEKQQNNLKPKKIVFIGHSYHNKTKSSAFFVDYLKQFYEVKVILDESWLGKPFADLSFVDESYAGIIFWQNLPGPEVLKNTKSSNIVFFPMYDSVGGFGRDFWEKYKNIKIVSFSKTIHERLHGWGFDSLYVQYFPQPKEFVPGNKKEIFFWQRLAKININTIKRLIGKEKVSVHLHTAVDPGYEFTKPTKDDEKKFSITYSDWFNEKSELLSLIKQKGIYVAPRQFEGIGLSFLEAMAMGKAVVAPNNPTMNEYIVHNQTGYLYDFSNPLPIDFSRIEEIQKNTYDFMCRGYKKWEETKYSIIDFIRS